VAGANARRVAVAMSGGLDSTMAAALLLERGFRVEGLTMRLWREGPPGGDEAVEAARGASPPVPPLPVSGLSRLKRRDGTARRDEGGERRNCHGIDNGNRSRARRRGLLCPYPLQKKGSAGT